MIIRASHWRLDWKGESLNEERVSPEGQEGIPDTVVSALYLELAGARILKAACVGAPKDDAIYLVISLRVHNPYESDCHFPSFPFYCATMYQALS